MEGTAAIGFEDQTGIEGDNECMAGSANERYWLMAEESRMYNRRTELQPEVGSTASKAPAAQSGKSYTYVQQLRRKGRYCTCTCTSAGVWVEPYATA